MNDRVERDIWWGVGHGLSMALVVFVLAIIGYAAEHRTLMSPAFFFGLLCFNLAGGVVGGAVLGYFRPLLAHWWGALILAMLLVALGYMPILIIMEGWFNHWSRQELGFLAWIGVIGGPIWAFMAPRFAKRHRRRGW